MVESRVDQYNISYLEAKSLRKLGAETMTSLPPKSLVQKVDCVRLYVSDLDTGAEGNVIGNA